MINQCENKQKYYMSSHAVELQSSRNDEQVKVEELYIKNLLS